jgi:hypothetical protein
MYYIIHNVNLTMSSQLNSWYFTKLYEVNHDGKLLTTYATNGQAIILFSKKCIPIASLHFISQDEKSKTIITHRPKKSTEELNVFHGMIDEDEQEIEFIISNLTCGDCSGYINFNIMQDDKKVTEVDPGGINKINEIPTGRSYGIKCDQKDSCSLILRSIIETTGKKKMVSVDEEKAKRDGTYYYLSVVPQIDKPKLVELFEGSFWATTNVFIRCENIPSPYPISAKYGQYFNFVQPYKSRHIPKSTVYDCCFPLPYYKDERREMASLEFTSHHDYGHCFGIDEDREVEEEDCECFREEEFDEGEHPSAEKIIMDSVAATMGCGRKIVVHSRSTDVAYNFDAHSPKCLLGLSISDKFDILKPPSMKHIFKYSQELCDAWIKNEYEEFLKYNEI